MNSEFQSTQESSAIEEDELKASTVHPRVRLLNYVIDMALAYFLMAVVGKLVRYTAGSPYLETFGKCELQIFSLALIMLYYLLFEFSIGRTPGKLVTGTKVVTENNEKPSLAQIAGRTLSRFVPFEPFSFLSDTNRGWHDRWSKTYVKKCR